MKAYRQDLAHIHDVGFNYFACGAGPFILDTLCTRGIHGGLVVDLGCGSGLWAQQLAAAGYDVLGVDISDDMLEIARQRVPEGDFRHGSILTFQIPKCAAVTSMGEVINYLFDKKNNLQALTRLFKRIYRALPSGGIFIFDFAQPGRIGAATMQFWENDDWSLFLRKEENKQTRQLTRYLTTFRRTGKLYRRDHEVHVLQLYTGAELAKELRTIGFRARLLRSYGDFQFPSAYAAILARKP